MKKFLVFLVVLVLAVGALGYWRGWFNVSREGVQTDAEKFKKDKAAFSKTVGEQATAVKDKLSNLKTKSARLTDAEKVELGELEKKHERLEQQLKELEEAAPDRFESIKQDLSISLKEVEKKIDELTEKVQKGGKDK